MLQPFLLTPENIATVLASTQLKYHPLTQRFVGQQCLNIYLFAKFSLPCFLALAVHMPLPKQVTCLHLHTSETALHEHEIIQVIFKNSLHQLFPQSS